jgi:excisionase family DNA binding protein
MKPRTYTTYEAAARIGVSRQSVYTWIRRGEIVAPELIRVGKSFIRLWTLADVERDQKIQRDAEDRAEAKEQKVMALFRAQCRNLR